MSSVYHRDNRRRMRNGLSAPTNRTSVPNENFIPAINQPSEYRFFCQLAHGSPTGIISGFKTVRELHAKIAECFDLSIDDIMYCTLNTHKLDVDRILGREIGLNDFLFAHIKSQPKEIRIFKDSESFGMTLTDTGCGVVFIKRLLPGGMMACASESCNGLIEIGDQIEKINNISFVGRRHFEVAAYLQSIPVGTTFLLRLFSPERSAIYMLNTRGTLNASTVCANHKKRTIRLRGNGIIEERMAPDNEAARIMAINQVLGKALGFEDDELAYLIYETAIRTATPFDLTMSLHRQLHDFYIPSEVLVHLWGLINQPMHYDPSSYGPQLCRKRRL